MNLGRLVALGSLASLAQLIEFTSRFGRTVILSHGLSTTEFGIGAALTLLIGIAELSTDIGLDRFLILRAEDEDEALGAVHGLSLLRGAFLAVVILFAAPAIATFLGAPEAAESFRALAGIVFLRSCAHLEMKRVQRHFRYAPDATAQSTEHLSAILAVYPAILVFGDHRAVLAMLYIGTFGYVVASHLVARRPYRASWRGGPVTRAAFRFGLPLTLNGMGLAAMSQLDRAVVSHWLGIEALALYTVILNLTVIPIAAAQRILAQLGMSFLARHRADAPKLRQVYEALVSAFALAGGAYAVAVAASADLLAPLIFGPLYQVPPFFHVLITLIVWIRLCRGAQNLMLLFTGETARLMLANIVACVWPLVAIPALAFAPRLESVLAAVLVGDLVSFAAFILATRRQFAGRLAPVWRDLAGSGLAVAIAAAGIVLVPTDGMIARATATATSAALLGIQLFIATKKLRR